MPAFDVVQQIVGNVTYWPKMWGYLGGALERPWGWTADSRYVKGCHPVHVLARDVPLKAAYIFWWGKMQRVARTR